MTRERPDDFTRWLNQTWRVLRLVLGVLVAIDLATTVGPI